VSETVQATAAASGQASDATATTAATQATATQAPTATEAPKSYTEADLKKLRDEAASYRVKLREFEQAEEARKTAELSETDRLKKLAGDAEAKATAAETRAREALGTAAITTSAAKLGVDAALARKLVTVEYDADGNPKGVDEALAALVKAHPYLIAGSGAGASATNGARTSGTATFDPKNPPRLGTPGLFKS
jgi:hypothetical protein